MEKFKWIVSEDEGVRIDKVVALQLEDLSRGRVQQLLEEGLVLVNNEAKKNNYKVKLDDVIEVTVPEAEELKVEAEDIPLDILYEDHDIIVINKAKGMVVHPSATNQKSTLVNAILFHCNDLSGINGVLRPGIVHRIDKNTTGCIVVCKNDKAHESISKQLSSKTCRRDYTALVHGVIIHDRATIDAPIGRDAMNRQKMMVTDRNARNAITHFVVKERFKAFTLVECQLETGRTHQIRVHMQYIGFPIVGDDKYSLKNTRKDTQGQMLHAHSLTLVHPTTQEEMTFHAPLPTYFNDILDDIRKCDS